MNTYRATFNTNVCIEVEVNGWDEDDAGDQAWEIAEAYLQTIGTQKGDSRIATVDASLDGIGADHVEKLS